MKQLSYIILTALFLSSCVPARQVDTLKADKSKCDQDLKSCKATTLELNTKNSELNQQVSDMNRDINHLKDDTSSMGTGMRRLQNLYNDLTASYDKLNANNEKLLNSNQLETKNLIIQLQKTQEELLAKEDSLKKLSGELTLKKNNLDELNGELKKREARVAELEKILASKDSVVTALKKSVSAALVGYTNNGLTVEQKNGKVYVSLEERLLFATGSINVEKEGNDAVKKLAKVLESNPDINILIEGHTDNVPMKGSGDIKDNWDLSVMRATSVVRIITGNSKVNPGRLTAAGRSEFVPLELANSTDARRKNRRIEIILSPKLDEIFKVIDSN